MATITSSIGTSSRNYSTLQAWEDALPVSAVAAGNDYVGEVYKDSEFVVGVPLLIAGTTTDATHGITLRAAAGQSFRDNPNVRTNALRYSAANGVAIRGTSGYNSAIEIQVPNVTLDGLQIAHQNNGRTVYGQVNAPANVTIKNCICEAPGSFASAMRLDGNNSTVQNIVLVNTGTGTTLQFFGAGAKLIGCTVVKTGTAGTTGVQGTSTTEIRNTVAANFTTCFTGLTAANCSNNASTDATAPGANSKTAQALASLFEAPGTDYRTKAGSALIDAGTAAGLAVDISGTARPQGSAYDIGAWEVAAAATGVTLTPGAATLAVTGYAPTVAQVTPTPTNIALQTRALAITGYAPTVAQTVPTPTSITLQTRALTVTGYAPSVTQKVSLPSNDSGASGGGAGSMREVRAFADQFDRADKKPTKAQKKARKKAIEAEALQLLPDLPQAEEVAPIIAQLVYQKTAPAFANWTPVKAMQPLPPSAYDALRAQVDAWLQHQAMLEEISDEHDVELLLLG
jgi:hypothetical protein